MSTSWAQENHWLGMNGSKSAEPAGGIPLCGACIGESFGRASAAVGCVFFLLALSTSYEPIRIHWGTVHVGLSLRSWLAVADVCTV